MGGKNKQTQNTREAWNTTQFLEFVTLHLQIDVDVILGTCSTIEIVICLKKKQSTPRPSEHPPPVMGGKRMRCRPFWSLSTLGSKHACDKNRRSSVTYASISVFPPHPIPSSRLQNTLLVFVVSTLKAVPISIQYLLISVLVQLTRMPFVVTG